MNFINKKELAKVVFVAGATRSGKIILNRILSSLNNIENIQFLKANLDTFFKSGQLPNRIPKPDVIIVDPPRAGMHSDMAQYLPKLKAKKIIYVSCNPTTQARDAKILCEKGYKLKKSIMVDMFPHTPHIENIVLFSKQGL